jgi:microcystin-dependent protein
MDSFMGEIRIFGFNFAPQEWAMCNGGTVPIRQYTALAAVIGTLYGGDGRTTIGLPDIQGRSPVGAGQGTGQFKNLAQKYGSEVETLTFNQMPTHAHGMNYQVSSTFTQLSSAPASNWLSRLTEPPPSGSTTAIMNLAYSSADQPDVQLNAQAVGPAGGQITGLTQAHVNRQPFLAMNFCISLLGAYPERPD